MTNVNNIRDEYRGFALFSDIEDKSLQSRNRAVVLANMMQDHMNKQKKLQGKGAALVLGYFNALPEEERASVKEQFTLAMKERGFIKVVQAKEEVPNA
jgi:hypothetical protein